MTTAAAGASVRRNLIDRNPLFGSVDYTVVLLIGALMTVGAVMVTSATVSLRGEIFAIERWYATPLRQCVFVAAGFCVMLVSARFDYQLLIWRGRGDGWIVGVVYFVCIVLLIAVLLPGVGASREGTQRAIVLLRSPFTLSFQPAEMAKVAVVIWLAALLARPDFDIRSFRMGFVPAFGSVAVVIGLIGVKDFGTAALVGVVAVTLLWVAGARWLHLIGAGLLGLAAGVVLVAMAPYRIQRLTTFFSENPDQTRGGYQIMQSLMAIGHGGWFGTGLGAGVRKYDYLPQDNNDFIFAILCEELGIMGGIGVIGLFLALLVHGFWIARRAHTSFGKLLATGITVTIALQAALNVAVVTNCVPTKGISLPFVSAGGSGVLFLGVAAGILASIGGEARRTLRSDS